MSFVVELALGIFMAAATHNNADIAAPSPLRLRLVMAMSPLTYTAEELRARLKA